MKKETKLSIVNVTNNQLPYITEDTKSRYTWVPFGVYGHDDFFDAVNIAYNASTTNAACVEGIADLIYGKGLYSKNEGFNELLQKIIPQEETKRVSFDLKLFGNAAYQVYWNVEGELSNLHLNNIENGFLPMVMLNMNSGVPAPEERQTIEDLLYAKFTGTKNAGKFMLSFNDDPTTKPTIDVIQIDNLHEKFQYVAEYAQDRILVAHRITSPLLFGIRTANNGFSSQSEEMKTAFSILQSMTIGPFQNLILNTLDMALRDGEVKVLMKCKMKQMNQWKILQQLMMDKTKQLKNHYQIKQMNKVFLC